MIENDLLQADGMNLQYLPSNTITVEMCEIAIKQNAHAVQFVPAHLKALVNTTVLKHIVEFIDDCANPASLVRMAISNNRYGFRNGWISSFHLNELFNEYNVNVPANKRRELLKGLGYDWHPHLKEGRVNNVLPGENGKPRLFVTDCHTSTLLHGNKKIIERYLDNQGYVDQKTKDVISLIQEMIDNNEPGFNNGWISSIKLNEILERNGLYVPRNKRREIVNMMGYDWHPHLVTGGRGKLNSFVHEENGYPILFTTKDNIYNNHTGVASIGDAYRESQGYQRRKFNKALSMMSDTDKRAMMVSIASDMLKESPCLVLEEVAAKANLSIEFANEQYPIIDDLIADVYEMREKRNEK